MPKTSVANTSILVIDQHDDRINVTMTNDSVNTIYISKTPAIANEGIPIYSHGSFIDERDLLGYIYKGPWYAIADVAGPSNLSWTEQRGPI